VGRWWVHDVLVPARQCGRSFRLVCFLKREGPHTCDEVLEELIRVNERREMTLTWDDYKVLKWRGYGIQIALRKRRGRRAVLFSLNNNDGHVELALKAFRVEVRNLVK
jgi:hypothetical protein